MDKRLWGSMRKRKPAGSKLPWLIGGAAVAVLAVGGLITWAVWPDDRPDPRATVYTDAAACLLTPAAGVTDRAAAPVWAGMQEASRSTRGKVSYLEVDGPQTVANAATYLGTLATGKCDMVLVVGSAQVAALDERASSFPAVKFVAVGGGKAQVNVEVLATADAPALTGRVRDVVATALSRRDG